LEGTRIAFLARHGIGHHLSPTEVNYRANIFALKSLGINRIISITACGSLREDYAPGDIVIPDQLVDLTKDRERSFFEDGLVAHISVADPFCPAVSNSLFQAVSQSGAEVHNSGSFVTIEGPRFSTRAESNIYRSWGISIIGMTASPEAFLAREAEMCYAAMAHVTDYDVWHISEDPVTAEMVFQIVNRNMTYVQKALTSLAKMDDIRGDEDCQCGQALSAALSTHPQAINPETKHTLGLLVNKYLPD
jgi:5'-methylthioadenosine phosphorylase